MQYSIRPEFVFAGYMEDFSLRWRRVLQGADNIFFW